LTVALFGLPLARLRADEPKPGEKPVAASPAPATDAQIAEWVKQLDHDELLVRQQATGRLFAAGRPAIAAVAKAAEGESAEVTARCFEVLGKLFGSADAEVKAAARQALEGLAKSKNPAAAGRAAELIRSETPATEPPAEGLRPRVVIGGIGAGATRITVRNVDGNKTIEVEEPDRKVSIEESAKGEIKMTVAETKDGKPVVSKSEAKSADDLKKDHPAAHVIYEKYAKRGGAVVKIGGIARPIRLAPIPVKAMEDLEAARKELQAATEQLRKLAESSRISPDEVKKLAERFEGAKKQLEEVQGQLPK